MLKCEFDFLNFAKPFRIQGIWECLNEFQGLKILMSTSFIVNFLSKFPMFGFETRNLQKHSASEAAVQCGEEAACLKADMYGRSWAVFQEVLYVVHLFKCDVF